MTEEKKKVLEAAIKTIENEQGKGAIRKMSDQPIEKVEVISTGSLALDDALGIQGIPRGRVVEIYGPESSGKTTLTLHIISECQKAGGSCVFVDAEHALDIGYARDIGVDMESIYISQPDNGENALEVVDTMASTGAIDLIVVDSVAALVPKSELEGDMGDAHMAQQARLLSQAMRKLTATISKTNTTVVFINQLRMKVGVFFGNPETTPGGNALKFYSSIRMDIRQIEVLKKGEEIIGGKRRVKVVKNKLAPPYKAAEVNIIFGKGIVRSYDLLRLAVKYDIVAKSGSWYVYGEERLGQGERNVVSILEDSGDLAKEIEAKVKEMMWKPNEKDIAAAVALDKSEKTDEKKKRRKAKKEEQEEKVEELFLKKDEEEKPEEGK